MASTSWELTWLPTAVKNRDDIYDWNNAFNPSFAKATDKGIGQLAKSIKKRPYQGPPGRVDGTRQRVLKGGKYLVVYRVDDEAKAVEITNVVSTSQQFPAA
jgi:plasmid stabilization system protein ParE